MEKIYETTDGSWHLSIVNNRLVTSIMYRRKLKIISENCVLPFCGDMGACTMPGDKYPYHNNTIVQDVEFPFTISFVLKKFLNEITTYCDKCGHKL